LSGDAPLKARENNDILQLSRGTGDPTRRIIDEGEQNVKRLNFHYGTITRLTKGKRTFSSTGVGGTNGQSIGETKRLHQKMLIGTRAEGWEIKAT